MLKGLIRFNGKVTKAINRFSLQRDLEKIYLERDPNFFPRIKELSDLLSQTHLEETPLPSDSEQPQFTFRRSKKMQKREKKLKKQFERTCVEEDPNFFPQRKETVMKNK